MAKNKTKTAAEESLRNDRLRSTSEPSRHPKTFMRHFKAPLVWKIVHLFQQCRLSSQLWSKKWKKMMAICWKKWKKMTKIRKKWKVTKNLVLFLVSTALLLEYKSCTHFLSEKHCKLTKYECPNPFSCKLQSCAN